MRVTCTLHNRTVLNTRGPHPWSKDHNAPWCQCCGKITCSCFRARCGASGGTGLTCDKPAGHPGQHRDSAVEAAGRLGTWIHAPSFDPTTPEAAHTRGGHESGPRRNCVHCGTHHAPPTEPANLELRPPNLQMRMFD